LKAGSMQARRKVKEERSEEIFVFEVLNACLLFGTRGFFCSLEVLQLKIFSNSGHRRSGSRLETGFTKQPEQIGIRIQRIWIRNTS
jgi:hypothetical protein